MSRLNRDFWAAHYIDQLIKTTGCLPSEIQSMRELLRVVLIENGFNAGWDALAELVRNEMDHTSSAEANLRQIQILVQEE